MYPERTLRTVVLPAPVPPEMMTLRRFDHADSSSSMGSVSVWFSIMLRAVSGSRPKRRMERQAPSRRAADDGVDAGTVCKRASTMGEDSSTRRPMRETMRSMICMRCWLS